MVDSPRSRHHIAMSDISTELKALASYRPAHKVRFVTDASLFDGHDAAINIMRRILQGTGAEVIHLGHNRSVDDVVTAALQEDVQGIAISSYQGGHVEYFKYMMDLLKSREEKQSQLKRLKELHARNALQAPGMLERLQQAVIESRNVFEVLMDAGRVCSLGQITKALFEVGRRYRRNK
jgi:CHAT domain-containing protein